MNELAPYEDQDDPLNILWDLESLPQPMRAPLAPYAGAEPPAPAWFDAALAQEPERRMVESQGSQVETLAWGERGRPGLLFLHGSSAHADWWSFIAPFFAKTYRVAAFSLPGMGGSQWRERYSYAAFVADAEAVAQATGLYEGGGPPLYVGHSFGGSIVYYGACTRPEQMRAAVMIDTGFGSAPAALVARRRKRELARRAGPEAAPALRVYATVEAALARFRLAPPQPVENAFVADFIARRSLMRTPLADGSGEGWTWRFDPDLWLKLDPDDMAWREDLGGDLRRPVAHIMGERSLLMARRRRGHAPSPLPPEAPEFEIPAAHHHVMIDQPLALVTALRGLFAAWPLGPG